MWIKKADYDQLIGEIETLKEKVLIAEGKVGILNANILDHWENFKHNQEQQTELFEKQKNEIETLKRSLKLWQKKKIYARNVRKEKS